MEKKPKVGIVIVNWNGKALLANCLESIIKNTKEGAYKVCVVDNCSTDGSVTMLKEFYPSVELIINKENKGFPIANNQGTKRLLEDPELDYIYFLNNDTIVTSNWLEIALKTAINNEADMVASRQLDFNGNRCNHIGWIKFLGVDYYQGNDAIEVGWANGAGLLVHRNIFTLIGLLDESYSPAYYEETDFEWRAKKRGAKIWFSPNSVIYHKGGASTGGIQSDKMLFSFYRNRIYFFLKYHGFFYFLPRLVLDIVKMTKRMRLRLLFKAYSAGLERL